MWPVQSPYYWGCAVGSHYFLNISECYAPNYGRKTRQLSVSTPGLPRLAPSWLTGGRIYLTIYKKYQPKGYFFKTYVPRSEEIPSAEATISPRPSLEITDSPGRLSVCLEQRTGGYKSQYSVRFRLRFGSRGGLTSYYGVTTTKQKNSLAKIVISFSAWPCEEPGSLLKNVSPSPGVSSAAAPCKI